MRVTVKLLGTLRSYLPAGSSYSSCSMDIESGIMLEQLLQRLPIPAHKSYLVIHNDVSIDAEAFAGIALNDNDEVVLLPPIKGG